MKNIEELKPIKGDAYDYYISAEEDRNLFEKIFLVDEIVDEIKKPDKYFLIGEKGSGKTAYSVYMSKNDTQDYFGFITLVENTVYQKFLNMKKQKALELSSYKDIWINIIYLVLAEEIRKEWGESLFSSLKYKQLSKAIAMFYSDAFKPELINAMEFVDKATSSINAMLEQGLFSTGSNTGTETSQKYVEQSYQVSLMKIRDGFERAFRTVDIRKPVILFIDGIDARPREIDNEQYFECLTGLVNAVLEMNYSVLREKNIKVMLLIRPDIMYKMPIHNMNQKLRGNSVLLDWVTGYRNYVKSKLFQIADGYFSKQQDLAYQLGECWEHYFPYKVEYPGIDRKPDNPFIEFLRYSLYKPRDILTMLNEMIEVASGKCFSHTDFENIITNYSIYLKSELKDYMLIYMDEVQYGNFILFFDYFVGCRNFSSEVFQQKHLEYVEYLRKLGKEVPPFMQSANEALQLLYDSNIICYKIWETDGNGKRRPKMFWSYKERNYANIQPEVRRGGEYSFHMAYAKAFRII